MMDCCRVMCLVNRYSCMNHIRLDSFLLNYGLYVFMDVMMNSLAGHGWSSFGRVCGAVCLGCISELSSLSVESSLGLLLIPMMKFLVLDRGEVVVVLLGEYFSMRQGLNCCMVMILKDFFVKSSSHLLMLMRLDRFLRDRSSHTFIDSCLVLSIVRKEAGNGGLCFLHCE